MISVMQNSKRRFGRAQRENFSRLSLCCSPTPFFQTIPMNTPTPACGIERPEAWKRRRMFHHPFLFPPIIVKFHSNFHSNFHSTLHRNCQKSNRGLGSGNFRNFTVFRFAMKTMKFHTTSSSIFLTDSNTISE